MPPPIQQFATYNKIPAQYVIKIELPGDDGARRAGVTQLRPEPFVCHRITFATDGDKRRHFAVPFSIGSPQGRSVEVRFGDSFTTFFGKTSGLVSAVFGDSQGFLDLPRGILFQGSQPIQVELTRLFWPQPEELAPRATTRWDFVFHGVSLLPQSINQSGSAG